MTYTCTIYLGTTCVGRGHGTTSDQKALGIAHITVLEDYDAAPTVARW